MQQASMFVIILSSVLVGLKVVAPLVKVFIGNVIHKVIA